MNANKMSRMPLVLALGLLAAGAGPATAQLDLGAPITVQDAAVDLWVSGYSVPTTADWDADGVPDLLVGEGGGGFVNGRVRIYRNIGTVAEPAFDGFVYAMAGEDTLTCPGSGCLGVFPRVVNWDRDGRKDLLIGAADGTVIIHLNTGTDAEPVFDAGALVQVEGIPPVNIDIGYRATPIMVDWNRDGRDDLLVGGIDGRLGLYLDTAATGAPVFTTEQFLLEDAAELVVPTGRSSPVVADFDGDGRRDLLSGNTVGQLIFYPNVGSDDAPAFSGFSEVTSEGVVIDLEGTARSRPCVCDWTGSGRLDVLVGSADGLVYLYEGPLDVSPVPVPAAVVELTAYPNPFNPRVTIAFELTEARRIDLDIYTVAGERVAGLSEGWLLPGRRTFTWDGHDHRGRALPSGSYIVRMRGTETDIGRKITLLR